MQLLRHVLIFMFVALGAEADQITLLNGDRLSGSVQKLVDGQLILDAELAGTVTLKWSNIAYIVSTQPLYVTLKDGRSFTGTVVNSETGLRLEDSDESIEILKDDVESMRAFREERRFQIVEERKLAPHFLDPWSGFADLGVSAARGNADVTTYTLNVNGVRATAAHKFTLGFTSLYARNSTQMPSKVTANVRRGNARYERNLGDRQFAFGSADLEFDELQKLDLRGVIGLGFGRHVLKTERSTFDLFAGATMNRELYSTGLKRLSGEALISQESAHKVNSILTIKQRFAFFPNVTDSGEYRIAWDSSAVTLLLSWLSWQVSISDRYSSNPVPGGGPNDLLVTTGFRFNLIPPKQP